MTSLDAAGPVLDAQGRVLDRIVLRGLRAIGHHGVLDFERAQGQPFGLDVALHLDTREAAAGDDLSCHRRLRRAGRGARHDPHR